jgi:hypothetical protein
MCTHPDSKHLPSKWLTTSPALATDYLHYFLPHPPSPIPLHEIAARYFLCYLVVLVSTSLLFPNLAVRLLIKSATVHTRLVTHICVPGYNAPPEAGSRCFSRGRDSNTHTRFWFVYPVDDWFSTTTLQLLLHQQDEFPFFSIFLIINYTPLSLHAWRAPQGIGWHIYIYT